MQERGIITNMDLKVYMNSLKNNPRLTEDMLRLVEEDLRFGLTPKETEEYTGKRLDYLQMKVYSQCLRGGYEKEVLEVITREGLSGEQMAVALEFYEKGVPLNTVQEVTQKSDQTAFTMRKLFVNVMEKLGTVQKQADTEEAYAKELVEQIREVVAKIDFQEKRYDALNEKLRELQTAGRDAKVQGNLLSQLAEKDSLLEKQQNEINEARVALARLRNELDTAGKERQILEKKVEEMKQQIKSGGQSIHREEKQQAAGEDAGGQEQTESKREPEVLAVSSIYPVEYQAAFVDKDGRIIQMVPVERKERKKDWGILTSLFSRISFHKRADIVKLVAEKGLEPKQLVQIRNAIEKGLTKQQLMVLINRQIPAEQMEEIINIAVYENRQKGEE